MLNIFSCACWSSVCLLWRNVCVSLLPSFACVTGFFDIELYELFVNFGNKALLFTSFVWLNIFSQSVGCLFILFVVSFAMQNLKSLIRFCLFLLFFLWEPDLRKYCYNLCQKAFPIFSSGRFMVLCLIFNSLSHSEFTFMYGVRKCSNFIHLHVAVQLSQGHLLRRLSLLYILAFFVEY